MIKRLQHFLGIDLDYIFRSGFWLGLDQVLSLLVGLGLSFAFANFLDPNVYGTYRYVLSFFSILTIATLPNMGVAVTTSVAKGFDGLLGRAVKTRIRWGLIGSAIAVVIAAYYFTQESFQLAIAFFMMAVFLPLVDSFNLYSTYLAGKKLFRVEAKYGIALRLISALAVVVALTSTGDLNWILLAFFLPYVLIRPIFLRSILKNYPPNNLVDPEMISYGKHLTIIQLLGTGVGYLDNLLIFHYLGAAPLAIYSIAMAPINKLQQVFSIFPDLALPKFSGRDPQETRKRLMRKVLRATIPVALGVLIYIVLAPAIFTILFPKYLTAVFYSQLLSLTLIPLPFGLLYTFFQSQAMKDKLYQYNVASRIIQLVLTVALVATLGVIGAVISKVIFKLFSTTILLLLYGRQKV